MTSVETRLRERIDTLTDERDRARQERDVARAERYRQKNLTGQARSARDSWRSRALAAEREVKQATRLFTAPVLQREAALRDERARGRGAA